MKKFFYEIELNKPSLLYRYFKMRFVDLTVNLIAYVVVSSKNVEK